MVGSEDRVCSLEGFAVLEVVINVSETTQRCTLRRNLTLPHPCTGCQPQRCPAATGARRTKLCLCRYAQGTSCVGIKWVVTCHVRDIAVVATVPTPLGTRQTPSLATLPHLTIPPPPRTCSPTVDALRGPLESDILAAVEACWDHQERLVQACRML